MRKFLISATLLASSLAIAAPAAAQWAQPNYGYGYGYNNNYGGARSLQVRLNNIERQIYQLDRRNILSNREANRLRAEANWLERTIRVSGRNGLNGYERRNLEIRLARLEQNVRYQATDGNRRYGQNQYGYGNGYNAYDRDRDGRDDRYEDDRGYRRD
ncbi:MAG: hypothetical protein V4696_10595 [Pseudomonadota bacterium]